VVKKSVFCIVKREPNDHDPIMRLGVISDTHDRIPAIERAVEIFNLENVDAVLHCGDFVSPFSLMPFRSLKPPLYAVLGNNDGERRGLEQMFEKNGWTLNDRPWSFTLDGTRIAMLHEPAPLERVLEKEEHDLIVFGHTHEAYTERRAGALIVNPGEACGWLKGSSTLGIVDTDTGCCEIKEIDFEVRQPLA